MAIASGLGKNYNCNETNTPTPLKENSILSQHQKLDNVLDCLLDAVNLLNEKLNIILITELTPDSVINVGIQANPKSKMSSDLQSYIHKAHVIKNNVDDILQRLDLN